MNLDIPWGGFDVETTSPDPETARIVQACVGLGFSGGVWQPQTWLLNPGIPIPAEATAIHGITDEMVADAPPVGEKVRQIAARLWKIWGHGGVVVVYNAPYDFTVLDRALRREGTRFKVEGPVIDPLVLDKLTDRYRKGSRRLEDTCRLFGIETPASHDAAADTFATVRLAWKIIHSRAIPPFDEVSKTDWIVPGHEAIPLHTMELDGLHQLQVEAYEEQKLSFAAYRRRIGDPLTDLSTDWPIRPYREGQ